MSQAFGKPLDEGRLVVGADPTGWRTSAEKVRQAAIASLKRAPARPSGRPSTRAFKSSARLAFQDLASLICTTSRCNEGDRG